MISRISITVTAFQVDMHVRTPTQTPNPHTNMLTQLHNSSCCVDSVKVHIRYCDNIMFPAVATDIHVKL